MDVFGQMQAFVRVVDDGGFSAAARSLGVPKSTVSRQITGLEDRLGVRLLHRTTRALRPTDAGQAYYERCTRILADLTEAEQAVTRAQVVPRGPLRISGPLTFGYLFLGEPIASFLAAFPEVVLDLTLSDRKVDLIDEGYDLAIRAGTLDDSSLVARRLGPATMMVVASPAYLERRGTPLVPQDLREHDCLRYNTSSPGSPGSLASWRFDDDVLVPVDGPLVSNNGDILRAAAVAGLGLIYVPRFIVGDEVRTGKLVGVLEAHVRDLGGIWAIYPANRHLSAKVRAFVDHLVSWLGDVPPWERCPT